MQLIWIYNYDGLFLSKMYPLGTRRGVRDYVEQKVFENVFFVCDGNAERLWLSVRDKNDEKKTPFKDGLVSCVLVLFKEVGGTTGKGEVSDIKKKSTDKSGTLWVEKA